MTKKRKQRSSKTTKSLLLSFWIIASLIVGTIVGYELAINPDNELFKEIGINRDVLVANKDSILPENIELCFTPPSGCAAVIVKTISKAKKTIYVQAYGMTSPPIVDALIKAQRSGVKVRILLDKSNLKDKWSRMRTLLASGIDVGIDKVSGIAHSKVMIIDEHIVITGSFNFTKSADSRNAENVIIIDDSFVATQYLQNWFARKAKNQSTPVSNASKSHLREPCSLACAIELNR